MKEYFVVSDIHSFYDPLIKALTDAGFDENNPEHIVICCGDMMDRGDDSVKVLNFFYKLFHANRTILIRGNHEDLFDEMIRSGGFQYHDITNGTVQTLGDLQVGINSGNGYSVYYDFDAYVGGYDKRWDVLRNAMLDYYEGKHYIFVHGWIPTNQKFSSDKNFYYPEWRNASKYEWNEARWANGMKQAMDGCIEPGKTIVCGHWHASYGNVRQKFKGDYTPKDYSTMEFSDNELFKPYYAEGIIAIDACTAHTGFVNCLHFTEEEL